MRRTNSQDDAALYQIEQLYGRSFDLRQSRDLAALRPAIQRLVRAGRVVNMGRGLYTIVERTELVADDPLSAASAPFADIEHYVSWRAALSRYGLTEMEPATIAIALRVRRTQRRVSDIHVRPVYQGSARFYGYTEQRTPEGSALAIATPEKAIVDSLDRPDLAGGLAEAVKALGRRRVYDPGRLVGVAQRFPSAATAARLGYLMSVLGIGDPSPLLKRVRRKSAPVLLDIADRNNPGIIDQAWRIADNVGPDVLRAWASR